MKKFTPDLEVMEQRELLSTIKASIQPTSPNSALISWVPVRGIKFYIVQEASQAFKKVGRKQVAYTKWVNIAVTNQTRINVGNLLPLHGYTFDVIAKGKPNVKSPQLKVVTPAPPPPLALPAPGTFTLTAISASPSTINLSWTQSAYASYYGVYIWNYGIGQWSLLSTTTASTHSIGSLAQGQIYYFQVWAHNNSGATCSNVAVAKTESSLPAIHTIHPASSNAARYALGPDSLWSTNPVWSDVKQKQIGDCWLEASMVEIAYRTPAVIQSAFTDLGYYNEDGTTVHVYNVRLYDASYNAHYITVDNEFPVDAQNNWIGNGNESGHIWASLFEKAYIIATQSGWTKVSGVANGTYESLNNGVASWALRAITGHYASQATFTHNSITDASLVNNAYLGNFYVVLLTTTPTNSHIDSSHYYALMTVTPGSPNASYGTYMIDNPWNVADGTYYGSVFTCNGTFLSQNWSYYDTCWF